MIKKLYIKTYGCQMNVYDSTKMADLLKPMGYEQADDFKGADMVILNTCHIREKASEKVYSELGYIRNEKARLKKNGKNMVVAVAGCVAQAEGHEIFARAPYVDIVVGSQSYHKLPEFLKKMEKQGGRNNGLIHLDFPEDSKFDQLPIDTVQKSVSAFLSIQEGCDKFCTFCVVPYTRGAEYSRTVSEVYREALALATGGAKEITLLGQNVNAFHGTGPDGDDWNLAKLIMHIAKIPQIKRIRYMTSHPLDMDDELIALHGEEEKLMPFLHLPVQSGSDRILKLMNRRHTADYYREIIEKVKKVRPDMAFSSDFIVGFPGETEADFEETMRIVKDVGYAQCYSFKYSQRPGTPAAEKNGQVPEEIKTERLKKLQNLINVEQYNFNKKAVGEVVPVLFDRKGKYDGQVIGKTPHMQSVHVMDGEIYQGEIADVLITEVHPNSLKGEIITGIQEKAVA